MSMTKAAMTTLLTQEIKDLSDNFDSNDYSNALDEAERETGWSFPVSDGFQTRWQKLRGKRHLLSYLRDQSSEEFKVRTLHLNQTWEHLNETIEKMDEDYAEIQESEPAQFAQVDSEKMFGTKVDAGFQYDGVGRDTTYDAVDNVVIFTPTED